MSGKYQPYPEYRDSGVEWLGEIPKHWMSTELKRYSSVQGGYAFSSDSFIDSGKAVIRIGDIKQDGSVSLDSCKYIKSEDAAQHGQYEVRNGDLLMAMTGATIGKAGWFKESETALLNQRVGSFKCNKSHLNYRFFWYVLNSSGYQEYIKLTAFGGAQPNISDAGMVGYQSTFPLEDEQKKIAKFLDHETAKIDTLIEKQQQLIKLLKEKRQAVISHAVTKGLNPNVPMRDSGVEWFNELPNHWKTSKLGYYAKISNGATPSRENLAFWEGGSIGWLNSAKVNDVRISKADQFITPLAFNQTSVQPVTNQDLVIAITGEGQTRGRVAICLTSATINQHLAAISITDRVLNYKYLFYYLSSQYERIRYESSGAGCTKGAITCGDIVSFPLAIPPEKEQQEIIKYISEIEEKLNSLIRLAVDQVELLVERRTALISSAVTGKIDVRNWQAPEPSKANNKEVAA